MTSYRIVTVVYVRLCAAWMFYFIAAVGRGKEGKGIPELPQNHIGHTGRQLLTGNICTADI